MSMRSTFYGLEIGKTGIYVSQKGLDVTGHNVSNVDTPGYTRQRLVNTSYEPYGAITQFRPVSQALVGSGARVMILDQLRSSFLDRQYRTEQTQYSVWATRSQGLSYIEALFENSDGAATLSAVLNGLFSGFNTTDNEPSDQQQRTTLRQSALELVEQFKHIYDQLIDQQKDQDKAVETVVNQINTIADRIAVLNNSIYSYELTGQPANDLRDKRNLLVDELSALVDVEYSGDAIGAKFELKIGGATLVSHTDTKHLGVQKVDNSLGKPPEFDQVNKVVWVDANGNAVADFNLSKIKGGELLGHLNLRDVDVNDSGSNAGIPYFIKQLNTLAQVLVQTINDQHRQGYTSPAGGGTSQNGVNFFYQEGTLVPVYKQEVDSNGDPVFDPVTGDPVYVQEVDSNSDPVFDTDGNPVYVQEVDGNGDPLFETVYLIDNVTAGNIRLSDEVMASEFNIAASTLEIDLSQLADGSFAQMGNNENMLAIFALSSNTNISLTLDDGTSIAIGRYNGFIDSLVVDVALTKNHSDNMVETQNTLLLSADTQRTSIAGVSLDEEMTNLIRYNHAYSGASRVITAMDEALDILINRMGRVGL